MGPSKLAIGSEVVVEAVGSEKPVVSRWVVMRSKVTMDPYASGLGAAVVEIARSSETSVVLLMLPSKTVTVSPNPTSFTGVVVVAVGSEGVESLAVLRTARAHEIEDNNSMDAAAAHFKLRGTMRITQDAASKGNRSNLVEVSLGKAVG